MKENKLGNIIKSQAIWVVFIVLCVGFTIANPRFITATNLLIMLRQVAVWGDCLCRYDVRNPAWRY